METAQTWPLYIVFILAAIGSFIGFVHPQTFGQQSSDITVGYALGFVALVIAAGFTVVRFLIVGDPISISSRLGNVDQPNANSLLGRAAALQQAIGALRQAIGENPEHPNANSVLGRLHLLHQAIGENVNQPLDGTLLNRLEQLRQAINNLTNAVGRPNEIQAGTVLSRLGPPHAAGG
jgi:hypothetical protein